MEVILLERVAKLGQMGATVKVRDGYARNFLLARGKALRATQVNKERFAKQGAPLERGQVGGPVKVRAGSARSFLLARGKALRATKVNKERFETQRAQLEARNLELRREAEGVGEKLNGQSFTIIRQSGDT